MNYEFKSCKESGNNRDLRSSGGDFVVRLGRHRVTGTYRRCRNARKGKPRVYDYYVFSVFESGHIFADLAYSAQKAYFQKILIFQFITPRRTLSPRKYLASPRERKNRSTRRSVIIFYHFRFDL